MKRMVPVVLVVVALLATFALRTDAAWEDASYLPQKSTPIGPDVHCWFPVTADSRSSGDTRVATFGVRIIGGHESSSVSRMSASEDCLVARYRWSGEDPKPVTTASVMVVQTGVSQGIVMLMPPAPWQLPPCWSSDDGAQITRLEVQPDTARPSEPAERMRLAGHMQAGPPPAGSHNEPVDSVTYESGEFLVDVDVNSVECLVVGKGTPTYVGNRIALVEDETTVRVAISLAAPR